MSKSYKTWPTIDRSDDIVEKLDRIIELLEVLTTTEVHVPSVWEIGDPAGEAYLRRNHYKGYPNE